VRGQVEDRRALIRHVSHLIKKEMCSKFAHLASKAKGDARYGGASPFYLTTQKKNISTEYSPWDPPSTHK
jgi:hypothetical protein